AGRIDLVRREGGDALLQRGGQDGAPARPIGEQYGAGAAQPGTARPMVHAESPPVRRSPSLRTTRSMRLPAPSGRLRTPRTKGREDASWRTPFRSLSSLVGGSIPPLGTNSKDRRSNSSSRDLAGLVGNVSLA